MAIVSKDIEIINKLGLHARAATKLAQLSQQFSAQITLALDGNSADASSIMAIMLLAGGQGKVVKVTADGDDAEQALASVCQLINQRFDEAE
ncbi:HPr family phosphocarrier protein [Thalassotalea euphylliae]|uniref:HPr family phosphocarrier protein n=1 Tax=Thalassotalea euphylliae TaxID=1655234 RepID=A0A3E0UC61_9GAMM|nr:HPr family phosphocarrier protein [Thalassotalea euphylliae]REL34430.1 HPr family phosphocarrier protein [Thalassotalea euphylliae]